MQAPYVQATLDGSSLAAAIADAPDHSATISLEIAPLTQSTGPPDDDQGPPVLAIKFAHTDLAAIANLVGLQTVCSDKQHDGSNRLYLLEQMTFLDR